MKTTPTAGGKSLPRGVPLYGLFALPRGLMLKVHAQPCTFAPGYIQSLKLRWPKAERSRS